MYLVGSIWRNLTRDLSAAEHSWREQYNQPTSISTAGWRRCDERCDATTMRRCTLRCTAMIAEGTKTGSICRHVNRRLLTQARQEGGGGGRQELGRLVKGSDRQWGHATVSRLHGPSNTHPIHNATVYRPFMTLSLSSSLLVIETTLKSIKGFLLFRPQSNLGMHAVQPNPNDLAANASLLCFACLLA